jgi:hypothetical protein
LWTSSNSCAMHKVLIYDSENGSLDVQGAGILQLI